MIDGSGLPLMTSFFRKGNRTVTGLTLNLLIRSLIFFLNFPYLFACLFICLFLVSRMWMALGVQFLLV